MNIILFGQENLGESNHYLEKLARVRLILVHKYVHLNRE